MVSGQPQLCGPSSLLGKNKGVAARAPRETISGVDPLKQKLELLKPGDSLIYSSGRLSLIESTEPLNL